MATKCHCLRSCDSYNSVTDPKRPGRSVLGTAQCLGVVPWFWGLSSVFAATGSWASGLVEKSSEQG
jgi:hypothetical protein